MLYPNCYRLQWWDNKQVLSHQKMGEFQDNHSRPGSKLYSHDLFDCYSGHSVLVRGGRRQGQHIASYLAPRSVSGTENTCSLPTFHHQDQTHHSRLQDKGEALSLLSHQHNNVEWTGLWLSY